MSALIQGGIYKNPSETISHVSSIIGEPKEKKEESICLRRKWTYYQTSSLQEAWHNNKLFTYIKEKVVNILVYLGNALCLYMKWGHKTEPLSKDVVKEIELKTKEKPEEEAALVEVPKAAEKVKTELKHSEANPSERLGKPLQDTEVLEESLLLTEPEDVQEKPVDLKATLEETSTSMEHLITAAEQLDEYDELLGDENSLPSTIKRQSDFTSYLDDLEQVLEEQEKEGKERVVSTAAKVESSSDVFKYLKYGAVALAGLASGSLAIAIPYSGSAAIEKSGIIPTLGLQSKNTLGAYVSGPLFAAFGLYTGYSSVKNSGLKHLLGEEAGGRASLTLNAIQLSQAAINAYTGARDIETGVLNYAVDKVKLKYLSQAYDTVSRPARNFLVKTLSGKDEEQLNKIQKIYQTATLAPILTYQGWNLLKLGYGLVTMSPALTAVGLAGGTAYLAYNYLSSKTTDQEGQSSKVQIFDSQDQVKSFFAHLTNVFSDENFQKDKDNMQLIIEYNALIEKGYDNETLLRALIEVESFDTAMKKQAKQEYLEVKNRLLEKYPAK